MTRWLALALIVTGCREVTAPPSQSAPASEPATTRILYPSAPGSFVDIVDKARDKVVAIRAATPVKSGPAAMFPGAPEQVADPALGTGFLIEAKGIYVLTNDHIATASTELRVVLPDRSEVPAKLVGRDTRLDIALLAVDAPNLKWLPLGESRDLHTGEWLVVLGNPFGDEVTASVGIVSATGREGAGSLAAGRVMGYRTFLQTDARIHRGNSGGPVLDTAGEVVGVAVATTDHPGELSFAIPIDRIKEAIPALRDTGSIARAWLGAKVLPVNADRATQLAMPRATGALVTEIEAGSPAARGGLRAGDVILKWADREVDHRNLPWLVATTPPGKQLTVTVWRNHAEVPVTIVTEKMPE